MVKCRNKNLKNNKMQSKTYRGISTNSLDQIGTYNDEKVYYNFLYVIINL